MIYLIRHAKDDDRYVGSWSNASILDSEITKVKAQAHYIKNNLNKYNLEVRYGFYNKYLLHRIK